MTNNDLENEYSLNSPETGKRQTDMTYWKMSDLSYKDIESLTIDEIKNPKEFTSKSYSLYVESSPSEQKRWDIEKALDDEETDTHALAFKKDDQIVISYRSSQELRDWFVTDPGYLILEGNTEPSDTRIQHEKKRDERIRRSQSPYVQGN